MSILEAKVADRMFLQATIAAKNHRVVAVIEGRSGEWEVFIASPQNMWNKGLKGQVNNLGANGSWVIETQRNTWGGREPDSTEARELYKFSLPTQDLQDAIVQIRPWLEKLSGRKTDTTLEWKGVFFTHLEGMRYEVLIQGPFDPKDYRKRFRQTKLVRWWMRYKSRRFFVRLIKSDKTLQDTCQALVDSLPEDGW